MSIIKLYLDEDSQSRALIQALSSRNVNVIAANEAGMMGKLDHEHLQWSDVHDRVMYTFNVRDFYRIHSETLASNGSHSGIILSQQHLSIGEQMRALLKLMSVMSAAEMRNHIEFLSNWLTS